ncbi:hypothetical protein [Tenacibaculum dicentrarchi]|uniref:hypothetical protein n=1 Tax=Tenacibaculum dicentrarchi TaxID=669041 RepID=UPI00351374B5
MNINLKRHKLLGILSKQRNNVVLKKAKPMVLGISFDKIYKDINCNEDELELISSELYDSKEIQHFENSNIIGLFAKDKGVTAFANKKYINRIIERRKERVKFILPILAILISSASLYFSKFANIDEKKFDKVNKEIQMKIDTLELQVNKLELKSYNNLNENNDIDSLTVVKN